MFPGCPEHSNIEGTLSKYSQNIMWQLGYLLMLQKYINSKQKTLK